MSNACCSFLRKSGHQWKNFHLMTDINYYHDFISRSLKNHDNNLRDSNKIHRFWNPFIQKALFLGHYQSINGFEQIRWLPSVKCTSKLEIIIWKYLQSRISSDKIFENAKFRLPSHHSSIYIICCFLSTYLGFIKPKGLSWESWRESEFTCQNKRFALFHVRYYIKKLHSMQPSTVFINL